MDKYCIKFVRFDGQYILKVDKNYWLIICDIFMMLQLFNDLVML